MAERPKRLPMTAWPGLSGSPEYRTWEGGGRIQAALNLAGMVGAPITEPARFDQGSFHAGSETGAPFESGGVLKTAGDDVRRL